MKIFQDKGYWALILGASSGIGLASARKLANAGMNLILIHRDRRSVLESVEREFESIRKEGIMVETYNIDALNPDKRSEVVSELASKLSGGRVRLLLHAISKGNLKLMAQGSSNTHKGTGDELDKAFAAIKRIQEDIKYPGTNLGEMDFSLTTQAMATSLLSWVNELLNAGLFASKARVIGLTSEGDRKVWKGYGAVAAAKATLEAISKYMAVEFAHNGLTTNIIQAGITQTPSLEMIPGSDVMTTAARYRNPNARLTTPEDIANVVYLMAQDEAEWINGARIVVDGGESLI